MKLVCLRHSIGARNGNVVGVEESSAEVVCCTAGRVRCLDLHVWSYGCLHWYHNGRFCFCCNLLEMQSVSTIGKFRQCILFAMQCAAMAFCLHCNLLATAMFPCNLFPSMYSPANSHSILQFILPRSSTAGVLFISPIYYWSTGSPPYWNAFHFGLHCCCTLSIPETVDVFLWAVCQGVHCQDSCSFWWDTSWTCEVCQMPQLLRMHLYWNRIYCDDLKLMETIDFMMHVEQHPEVLSSSFAPGTVIQVRRKVSPPPVISLCVPVTCTSLVCHIMLLLRQWR